VTGPVSIEVRGIRATGRHGANPGERDTPQEFVIDAEVRVNPSADELSGTVDYRDVVETVQAVVRDRSFVLLETIAAEVVRAVAELPGVVHASVVVHKPGAAANLGVDDVTARAESG
jgi:dihydroneopterin aldolase